MKKFSIIGLILILSSCSTTAKFQSVNFLDTTLVDYPAKGVIVSATLGERLVAKGYLQEGPAYEVLMGGLLVDNEDRFMDCSFTSNSRQSNFISKKNISNGDMCAGPFNLQWTTNSNCQMPVSVNDNICFSNEKNEFYLDKYKCGRAEFCNETKWVLNQNLIKKTRKQTTSSTNFVQELIYNGKVDNNIKFIYREFSENMIRPAFNQTVQYDFNESKFISFKGLTLEIIEANNQLIKYRLISNF